MLLEVRRILVATDLSEVSQPLIRAGASLARRFNAGLIVLHVDSPTKFEASGQRGVGANDYKAHLAGQLWYQVEQTDSEDVDVRVEVLEGESIASTILTAASQVSADLIVVGTHSRSGLRRTILGSVAEEVLRRAPCPVVVVPEAVLEVLEKRVETVPAGPG